MKAAILEGPNLFPVYKDVPNPELKPGYALINLKAAALNHRDLWICKGQYAGIQYPIILGSDGVGTVSQVSTAADNSWVGQEVIINPSFGWGDGEKCDRKNFKILGLPDNGTWAEQIAVPVMQLVAKPAFLSTEEAAALPLGGLTGWRALFSRAQLQPKEKLLITGIGGGVALLALRFAVAAGAQVVVTSSSEEKLAFAQKLGAIDGINYRKKDWAETLEKKHGGFDVILDSAGGDGFSQLIDLADAGGRIVFFGTTTGNPTEFNLRKVFWKQLNLLGTTMGSPRDFSGMMKFVEKHQIKPQVDRTFPLAEAEQALACMDKAEQTGKLVLKIS